jgi:hypothetical protein
MGYVLTTDSTIWRAETAGVALVALVELRRDGDPAMIRDDAGRRVAPRQLLAEAVDQARDPGAQRSLAIVLADYVAFLLQRELDAAREMWVALSGPDREADLLLMEAKGEPTADLRRSDAADVERLNDILFGDGAWREAGGAWAYSLGEPPRLLLDELVRRHPDGRPDQFVVGAYEQMASRESGSAADGLGDDRAKSLVADLVQSMSAEDLVQIVAEAVRVNPSVRSRAELLVQEWRRLSERAQWASSAEASSPTSPPTGRPSGGRPSGPAR